MKWHPSGKKGSTKWSYTGLLPNEDVFFKVIGIEKGNKGWKTKKIDLKDFEEKIGYIHASVSIVLL